jgi:hypothetical protein
MAKIKQKSKHIAEILKTTSQSGEKYFDVLNDKTEEYLVKLVKVVKGL